MLVVHGTWHDGALLLWAEDSTLPAHTSTRGAARPHPYAAPASTLAGALARFDERVGELVAKAAEREVVVLLPGTTRGPLASPELGREPGRSSRRTQPRLYPWVVPALAIDPAAALDLLDDALAAADSRDTAVASEPDLVFGGDLGYVAVLADEARWLVSRGRVLPTLVREPGGLAARWRPVLAGADADRFRRLAAAVPAICRAVSSPTSASSPCPSSPGQADTPQGRPATHVVLEALVALADAAVRARLGAPPLDPDCGRAGATTPAERWFTALTGHDARVGVSDAEAGELSRALHEWFAAAHRASGPVRACFRLVEPDDETPWRVEFAMQSVDDPSLLVSAVDLWAGHGPDLPGCTEDTLLEGLGRAARLYPEIRSALRAPRPAGLDLDTAGAYRFLKEAAPLLAAAGFGVHLPRRAGATPLGRRLTTRTRPTGGGTARSLGMDDLVDFRWDLALGDETIDPDELLELARLKVPLVRLRDRWVELDRRQLDRALRFLREERAGTMTAGEALRAALPVDGDEDLPVVAVDAEGPLGDLLSGQAERRLAPVPAPPGFGARLRPYQERGLAWLRFLSDLGLGAVLADDMGLGKTVQLLALLAAERATGARPRPTLLVCPMSVVGNWQREAARFTPRLAVHVHHGADRLTGAELRAVSDAADLVITTYATAARDREALTAVTWGRVVCDEAQHIKNSATRQAQAVRALPAAHRVAMTGTPVENHLGELWSIMDFANPGLLGPAARFRRRFAIPIERHGDEETAATLRRITGPFVLRRVKTDPAIISDLPDKQEIKVYCNLTAEQASLYQATVDDMLARIADTEGIERRGLVLATMTKLKQVCNHPAHLLRDGSRLAGRSGKLARLEEILEEVLAEGDKALCFTQYAEWGAMLAPHLSARLGRAVLWLHGGTSKRQRDLLVERFQEDPEPTVLLLSLKAGGTGLNLTAANHVIHADRWWNPAVEEQASDRAYRIGQRRDVQVRKLICVGTLEERIDQMIESKRDLAARVVGAGEEWLTELSTDELREVVALAPEAVSR